MRTSERASPRGTGHGKDDIGQLGRGVHEEVGMDVEVQRLQRLAAPDPVGVGHQQIGAEPHQSADRVRSVLENGLVQLIGRNELPPGRSQGPLR